LGTRAHAMTGDRIPKALLPVGGMPIVFRQMRVLRREGVARLTVLAGHLGAQLAGPLGEEARNLGLALDIRMEERPLGTAGCLAALAPADGDALLVYGDMLFDLSLAPLAEFHRRQGALITIVAHPNDHPRTSDLIRERDGRVTALLPREIPRTRDERNLVPAGLYLASADFFSRVPPREKADMVRDVLPRLVAAGEAAHDAQLLTVAITNRPQVARGDITFDDLDAILGRLEALLAEQGGMLDRIYVCPHHPDSGFPGEVKALKIRCDCRKPGAL